jgi:nucleotide-binding universal stress UspA family protein
MTFKKILVALDGSQNSQIAANYGFWLASNLQADLAGQHVVDPRLVDLFIEPEFAEELGFSQSIETSEKVFSALRKIGKVILDLFSKEAAGRGFKTTTFLDEGYIVDEILKYAEEFDLLVMGHRGRGQKKLPTGLMLGSVAERVVVGSDVPVLITVQPVTEIKQILVAFDGSEPSRGALLMAENLAKRTESKLKALTIIPSEKHKEDARIIREQGESFLREYWVDEVFSIKEGAVSDTLLDYANTSNSLLVLGAYGFGDPDKNVLGSTTTKIIRETKTSVLVYKPIHTLASAQSDKLAEPTVK